MQEVSAMTKKLICPNCEQERLVEPVNEEEKLILGRKTPGECNALAMLDCKRI